MKSLTKETGTLVTGYCPGERRTPRAEIKLTQSKLAMTAIGLLLSLLLVSPAFGETGDHETVSGHEITHDYHKNLVVGFIGYSGETRRENGATFGIGYLRRVNKSFSVGALVERTTGDLDFWVYALPIAFHTGNWKLFVAPGIEDSDHHGSNFLVRVGAEYAIDIGNNWELAPQISVDFVNGEQLGVLGIAIGRGF
jgi:hypothetical protein